MSDYYVPQPLFWLLPLSRSGLLNLAHVFPYSEFKLLKSMILFAYFTEISLLRTFLRAFMPFYYLARTLFYTMQVFSLPS